MSRFRNSNEVPLQAPEMTTAEIHALISVADGMIVYNKDTRQLLSHVGGSWLAISNSNGTGTVTSIDTGVGLVGGPITGAGTIELDDTAVTAGTYSAANITVDSTGRITAASSGEIGTVDSVVGTTDQINVDSTDPANPVVSLIDTAVTAGTYSAANITVDSTGRITAASSGEIGTVDSVVGTTDQINVDSTDPANPVVSLIDTAVTAGSYTAANITVDAKGRITAASSDLIPDTITANSIVTWGANGNLLNNSHTQIDNTGNMTLSGVVYASSFNSVGNLTLEESGKLRILSSSGGVVQINSNASLADQADIDFYCDLSFPADSGVSGQTLTTDGSGNLSWTNNLSSIISRDGSILIDTTDPIDVDIELPATGVAAGTYSHPSSITFDQYGRAIAATAGNSPIHGMIVITQGSGPLGALLPNGVTAGKVTVIGGGGNGGNTASTTSIGTGGGAGGTAIKYVTGLTPSSTYSVGAATELSSFSIVPGTTTMLANPGSNGISATTTAIQSGGAGGGASGGDINILGQTGDHCSTASTVGSAKGGDSSLAAGGSGVIVSGDGISGMYGSGGSGAFKSTTGTGGTGGSGIIIIEY